MGAFQKSFSKHTTKSQLRHILQQNLKGISKQEMTQSNDACKSAGCGLLYLHSFLYDHI
jgi:hypothetical protein